MNLLKDLEIREVGAPISAANNTDSNSDRIDMSGYEEVAFICAVTDSVTGGVATLTIEQNDSDSDTGMDDLTGATATSTATDTDSLNDQLLAVSVVKPQKRYIQCVRTSTTQNIAFGSLIAILRPKYKKPITDDDTILQATTVISPEEA